MGHYKRAEYVDVLWMKNIQCEQVHKHSIEYRTITDGMIFTGDIASDDRGYAYIPEIDVEIKQARVFVNVWKGKEYRWSIISPYCDFFNGVLSRLPELEYDVSRLENRVFELDETNNTLHKMHADLIIDINNVRNRVYNASLWTRIKYMFTGKMNLVTPNRDGQYTSGNTGK